MSILERIYSSAIKFLGSLNLDETYKAVVEEAINLTSGQYGTIYLESEGELRKVFSTMPQSVSIELRKRGYRYKAFKQKRSILIHKEGLKRLKIIHPDIEKMEARSILIVPLVNRGMSFGLLTIDSTKDKRFTKKDLEVLRLFGSLATLAIKKSQLYDEIKDSLATRDLFISLAAHELRTPLTTINGYVQLLLSKLRDKKPIRNRWVFELALESRRLKTLIEEFLEINRVRTGKLQFNWEEVSIKELIRRGISSFRFNYPMRKVVFEDKLKNGEDKIIADPDKIVQVFINIIENAHKYSEEDKKIYVVMHDTREYFLLEVTDQGQGIAKSDLSQVFKGFYKGENSKHEGMGLGLYLTKNIIDAHHGEITLRSKIGEGTNVRIKLPKI